jgi:hypothetical protein
VCNHSFSGKSISITYSECVFVEQIYSRQCAFAILSSVVSPALPYFFLTLSHKQHYFQKDVIEHKMYVLIFSTNFV